MIYNSILKYLFLNMTKKHVLVTMQVGFFRFMRVGRRVIINEKIAGPKGRQVTLNLMNFKSHQKFKRTHW